MIHRNQKLHPSPAGAFWENPSAQRGPAIKPVVTNCSHATPRPVKGEPTARKTCKTWLDQGSKAPTARGQCTGDGGNLHCLHPNERLYAPKRLTQAPDISGLQGPEHPEVH